MTLCKFCKSAEPKTHEIDPGPILLHHLRKFKYFSEICAIEQKSHCLQEFEFNLARADRTNHYQRKTWGLNREITVPLWKMIALNFFISIIIRELLDALASLIR